MSETEIRGVLKAAFEHCPEDVAETLRLQGAAQDALNGLSSAQLTGPDAVPGTVDAAFEAFLTALDDLAGNIAHYAAARSEVPA